MPHAVTAEEVSRAAVVKVQGTAAVIRLDFEASPSTEVLARRWKSPFPTHQLETLKTNERLRRRLRKGIDSAVGKGFGGNYAVHAVDLSDDGLKVTVFGLDRLTPNPLSAASGGRTFETKCIEALKHSRSKVQALLNRRVGAALRVSASWAVGDGVTIHSTRTDSDAPEELIRARVDELRVMSRGLAILETVALGVTMLAAIAGLTGFLLSGEGWVLVVAAYIVLPGVLVGIPATTRKRGADAEIRELSDALELRDTDDNRERRALKLVQANSFALRRYYDQGLRQRTLVFALGVLCILAGFGTVAVSFVVLDGVRDQGDTAQIVVGVLGAVGALLANYVATIFLRMFAATIKATTEFHTRLVDTQHVHLGYLAVAKIRGDGVRDPALAEMAVVLSGGTPEASASSDGEVSRNGAPPSGLVRQLLSIGKR